MPEVQKSELKDRAEAVCETEAAKRGLRAVHKDIEAGRFGQMTPYAKAWLRRKTWAPLMKAIWSLAVGAATIGAFVISCRPS